eukprot:g12548.t1
MALAGALCGRKTGPWRGLQAALLGLGVVDIETQLKEKRVAWVAHTARAKAEGTYWMIKDEVDKGTPWGKQVRKDLEEYGWTLEGLADFVSAGQLREEMIGRRLVAAAKREKSKGKKAGGAVTEKTKEAREKRRANIEEIRKEIERKNEENRKTLQKINGKRWARVPGAGDKWKAETEGGEEVEFVEQFEYFCENTGRTLKQVMGKHFYQGAEGVWWANRSTPGDLPYAQCEDICRNFGSDCGSFNYVNAPPLTTRTFVDHATGWQTTTLPAAASCTFFRADALAFAALSNNTGDRFAVRPASLDLSTTAFPGGGDSSTQAGSKFCYDGTIDFATVTFVNDFGTGPLDAAGIANGAAQPTAVNRTEGYKLDSTLLVLEENTNSAVAGEPHSWYQFPSEQHCKLACTKAAKCQGVFFETASKKCTLYSLCATKPLATGFLTGKGFFRALTKASNAETGGLMALYRQKLLAEEKEFVAKLPLAKSGLGSDVTFHCDVGETSQFALQRWMYVLDPDDGAGSNLKVDGVADVKECLDSCLQVQNCRGFNYHQMARVIAAHAAWQSSLICTTHLCENAGVNAASFKFAALAPVASLSFFTLGTEILPAYAQGKRDDDKKDSFQKQLHDEHKGLSLAELQLRARFLAVTIMREEARLSGYVYREDLPSGVLSSTIITLADMPPDFATQVVASWGQLRETDVASEVQRYLATRRNHNRGQPALTNGTANAQPAAGNVTMRADPSRPVFGVPANSGPLPNQMGSSSPVFSAMPNSTATGGADYCTPGGASSWQPSPLLGANVPPPASSLPSNPGLTQTQNAPAIPMPNGPINGPDPNDTPVNDDVVMGGTTEDEQAGQDRSPNTAKSKAKGKAKAKAKAVAIEKPPAKMGAKSKAKAEASPKAKSKAKAEASPKAKCKPKAKAEGPPMKKARH